MPNRSIVSLPCATVLQPDVRVAFAGGVARAAGPSEYSIGAAVDTTNGTCNALVRLDEEWTERRATASFPAGTELVDAGNGVTPGQAARGERALFALQAGPDPRLMVAVGRLGSTAPAAAAGPSPQPSPQRGGTVASTPPPTRQRGDDPEAEVERRAAALMADTPGMTPAAARLRVFQEDDQLRQDYVRAKNGAAPAATAKPDTAAVDAELERRVAAVQAGRRVDRAKAVAAVFGGDEDFRQRYVASRNGAAR